MKLQNLLIIVLLLIGNVALGRTVNDKLVISNFSTTYRLKADKEGKLASVKIIDNISFRPLGDTHALAYVGYGESMSIDKASAPGAKPQYGQWLDDDIFYEDFRICGMSIPLKVGKVAEATFERTQHDPKQFCKINFPHNYPVESYTVRIEVPKDLTQKLEFIPRHFPDSALISSSTDKNGATIYEYKLTNLPDYKSEALAVPYALCSPQIMVRGTFESPQDLYLTFKSYVEQEQPTAEMRSLVQQITQGCNSDIEKVDAIAAWVRDNIRYVAIEHGEYGHKPAAASQVLSDRFGDCKGSANLIKALLRASGLDGRLVWIGTRDDIDHTWEEFPSFASGNHMIAACVLPDTIVFADGTARYTPQGYIGRMIQGQQAIIEDGENCMLRYVPELGPEASVDSLKISYVLDADNVLTADAQRTFSGFFAAYYEQAYQGVTASQRDKMMHRLATRGSKSANIDQVEYERKTSSSPISTLTFRTTVGQAVKKTGDRLFLTLPLIQDGFAETVTVEGRLRPLQLPMPYRYVAEVELVMPDGYQPQLPTEMAVIDTPWHQGSVSYQIDGNILLIKADLQTRRLDAGIDELKQWNDCLKKTEKFLNPVIKITKI